MGLDMYLYAEKSDYKSKSRYDKEDTKLKYPSDIKDFADAILDRNFMSYHNIKQYQIGYWRKFNALHNWFVEVCNDGVDDCKNIYISKQKLKDLQGIVDKVLADHALAKTLLPTQSGFFFGSLEYDEWYFDDLKYTKDLIDKILDSDLVDRYDIVYCASW